MYITLQRIALVFAGIVFAVALYIIPDLLVNLGETLSFSLKIIWTIALVIVSIAVKRMMESAIATFTTTASLMLALLLAFGAFPSR